MLFSAVASYNNSSGRFDQSYEELGNDLFEQFLTFSPIGNESLEHSTLPNSTYFGISGSHSGGTYLDFIDSEAKHSIIHTPWQGESRAITQDEASFRSAQGNAFYAEVSGRAAASDSELLSLKCITLDSPQNAAHPHNSLPSSPSPSATRLERRKNRLVESLSRTVRKVAGDTDKRLRSSIREPKPSPNMKRSQSTQITLDKRQQKLTLDASKFNFDFGESMTPLSSPSSARVFNASDDSSAASTKYLNGISDNSSFPKKIARTTAYNTPLATPNLDTHHTRRASFQQLPADEPFFPITPEPPSVSASWSQSPRSSKSSLFEASTLYSADIDVPVWWNHFPMAPMAQQSPTGFHANPQRATKSLAMQLQKDVSSSGNELAFDPSNMVSGLMIQMPDTIAQQSFVMGTSPLVRQGFFASTRSQPHCTAANRQNAHALSRQPQSSSPIRKNRSRSSDSDSLSPRSTTFNVRKHKSPKTNKHCTPRTPSTPGVVDFVNYTPNDSRMILTGVAPSGSSKTKARREKEALEKRRMLSQAAVRAVREAGGDVESLVEQGLFV